MSRSNTARFDLGSSGVNCVRDFFLSVEFWVEKKGHGELGVPVEFVKQIQLLENTHSLTQDDRKHISKRWILDCNLSLPESNKK